MSELKRRLRRIIRESAYGQDKSSRFQDIMEEIRALNEEALEIARSLQNPTAGERAYRYWYAHIDGAIGSSGFLGGSMITMESTLEEIDDEAHAFDDDPYADY